MKLKAFKEKDKKKIRILLFTITCIMLITGVILYKTFAIFEIKTNQNIMNGQIQEMGNLSFMVYVDGELQKDIPNKNSDYSLDTSKSYCEDLTESSKKSHISWNQESWSVELKNISTTKTKCYLYFDQLYKDEILNGAIPDLGNVLIPVTIDEAGTVRKADLTKEWYNYTNKQWANAVILLDDSISYTDVIPESNIASYFVWIPRYKYKLFSTEKYNTFTDIDSLANVLSNASIIDIIFETNQIASSNGSTLDSWLTHPAFTSFHSNGFWVGKFETGFNQNEDTSKEITSTSSWTKGKAQEESSTNVIDSSKVIIKPNVYSWRNIQIANAFYTSYYYRREIDSHMMKNMEWGAVAYLSHSNYGSANNSVRLNNNSNFLTGFAAVTEPTCGLTEPENQDCKKSGTTSDVTVPWNSTGGKYASTTSNITGIYDMAGGANEYVMGVTQSTASNHNPASGRNHLYNSGFNGLYTAPTNEIIEKTDGLSWPSSKYYDVYDFLIESQQSTVDKGYFGDATTEMGPFYAVTINPVTNRKRPLSSWHLDDANFIHSNNPWFHRGDTFNLGTEAGIFAFRSSSGNTSSEDTFRIVLTP